MHSGYEPFDTPRTRAIKSGVLKPKKKPLCIIRYKNQKMSKNGWSNTLFIYYASRQKTSQPHKL